MGPLQGAFHRIRDGSSKTDRFEDPAYILVYEWHLLELVPEEARKGHAH